MLRPQLLLSILLLLISSAASAAAYIKFDGVDGESKDSEHKGWNDLESVTWLTDAGGASSAAGDPDRPLIAGRVPNSGPGRVKLVIQRDRSTQRLRQAAKKRQRFERLRIDVPDPQARDGYLRYVLKDVIVSSAKPGTTADGRATEEVTLNYAKIEFKKRGPLPKIRAAPRPNAVAEPKPATPARGGKKGNVESTWKVEEGEK